MGDVDQPSVLDLVNDRLRDKSRPAQRTDSHKLGLVIEGGGMRGVVAGGMISALESLGVKNVFDVVYGTSAGAIIGAYFVADQARVGTTIYYENINNSRFISRYNIFSSDPVMSLEFLLDHVCVKEKPLAAERVLDGPIPLIATATSLSDQATHALGNFSDREELFEALRCSARIPWVAGEPVQFRGQYYVDGGVVQPIPYKAAIDDGCTHIVALLTRPRDTVRAPAGLVERYIIARWLNNRSSGLGDRYLHCIEQHTDQIAFLHSGKRQSAAGVRAMPIQITPGPHLIGPLEKERLILLEGAKAGFQAVYQALGRDVPAVTDDLRPRNVTSLDA